MTDLHIGDEYTAAAARFDHWLSDLADSNPFVLSVERVSDGASSDTRWCLRLAGEYKDFIAIRLRLGQRLLKYESFVAPAPTAHDSSLFEFLLRQNDRLAGAHFAVDAEHAIYLRGELPVAAVNRAELDRVIGTVYVTIEDTVRDILRLGFGVA